MCLGTGVVLGHKMPIMELTLGGRRNTMSK